ncbi:phosphoribosylformylglycinamidine synthase ii : Phosphoribosylformylglycinamidine synthase subunit PurL OS=Pirellula staleyi (strain ATCC 27377 / DSM 6068 / ICPB 4128) GN=purL PE=3 SV=1: AIRS: AIRS_C: AIRS: AIRS_C [Gemmataceae bacterium]|nr:phosphoribosylformylglycinamidine synthase ii : Phosphoribosylformylglycinamidine synthase subunit PurL OS=Pirellula staleyi (strain ATCC 27377 / DSM 6068 / ICPB 4128) GN=purL PE=3 SV=1: AIRS: AIRS_C: AIRS: AIRS_C [Gemmataceae bacterium]VTU02688.1 phosphoribosylformylglycinamidine synthase ii : Phosphoribosylformylglycinamidine synthase subunit PurL OS=Pirellula staleyi (strain ATCC 27377 / DSM 6068 / ICPB 4128) GN=purL PE=3 SV=1: AIRS: AIRS_C: AIRS: AIRS_C [Gemmataceae bacterium]
MLFEVEIRPLGRDGERERVCDEFDLLTHAQRGGDLVAASARGFLLEGDLSDEQVEQFTRDVLIDPLVETGTVAPAGTRGEQSYTVLLKPGVMDPVAQTVLDSALMLGLPVAAVRTFRRYFGQHDIPSQDRDTLFRRVLANDAIERVVTGPVKADHLGFGTAYQFKLVTVPIRDLDDAALVKLSKDGMLALTLDEMKVVQAHFRELGREPTDCELESVAQTWSEHCSHKTLKGTITLHDKATGETRTYKNLLKETVFAATQEIRQRLGADDWCVSVFADNAGVVKFDDENHLCFKVETHNHPSAIEPYGGANTGLGGVVRDLLGTGLAAKPVCNTDVFCFAPPDFPPEQLPQGVLHPRRVMQGVVAGVRDYGNRMGIPTVNGAVMFDERYLANPLVFCGTVGIIPADKAFKQVMPGDLIVAVGGRTGRDGIHGATFSSLELTHESETVSGGAVQIGNAITEKKVQDVILQARDRGLFTAITDCGAGGFSSAVGEMGAELGATLDLATAPLKYEGLSYTEIWISESQERMVLSVPPAKWPELQALCESEDVEAVALGTFDPTGRLKLTYGEHVVADLDMHFLHDGRPNQVRSAEWAPQAPGPRSGGLQSPAPHDALLRILSTYSVASKEWVIRQYDHEVQGGSVVKPLVGVKNDGPSDAAVIMPVLGSWTGAAVGCGVNPLYDDPYWMGAAAIDEAVRNVVAVGADPTRTAILDNFCWGNVNDPAVLGALVRTAEACRDVALAFGTPFVSGKDSLNNTYAGKNGERINIPHTLLVSALGRVPDVRKCVTMDLKESGNSLYLVGETKDEMSGSHLHRVTGRTGGEVPKVDLELAPKVFAAVHAAITGGFVRACHDLSEGGLAVALAEMAFAGNIGADVTTLPGSLPDEVKLFSESCTRFVVEVKPEHAAAFEACFVVLPLAKIGTTVAEPRLRIAGAGGEWLVWAKLADLKEAWQKPLRW